MTVRLDPLAAAPSLMKEWHRASLAISGSLDPALAELIEIRSSQINGCANCINMHSTYARERGETGDHEHRAHFDGHGESLESDAAHAL